MRTGFVSLRSALAVLAGAGALTLLPAATAMAAPANDNFADAQVIDPGLPFDVDGSNASATTEVGEPDPLGVTEATVWYRWTPNESQTVSLDVCDSDFDTTLAVFTGATLGGLTERASNDDACETSPNDFGSAVALGVTAGTTYHIAVGGFGGDQGDFTLAGRGALLPPDPPANDDLANAQLIGPALPISVDGTNLGATAEDGEPQAHAGPFQPDPAATVWYRWTPTSGYTNVTVDVCDSDFDTRLGVFTGSNLAGLTRLAGNDDTEGCGLDGEFGSRVTLGSVAAGTTYRIVVDGFGLGDEGDFVLRVEGTVVTPPPTTDPTPDPAPDLTGFNACVKRANAARKRAIRRAKKLRTKKARRTAKKRANRKRRAAVRTCRARFL